VVHQPSYSILNRWVEDALLDTLAELGIGSVAFSPMAQGFLTSKYLDGVPDDSRASRAGSFPKVLLTPENLERLRALDAVAHRRGQSLAQMAVAWVLRGGRVTSALIGARTVAQVEDTLEALANTEFADEELAEIDLHALVDGRDLWRAAGLLNPILRRGCVSWQKCEPRATKAS
jgi:L-glyceraldehyde 3-phosphate reductase